MSKPMTRVEEKALQKALAAEEPPNCPRCGHLLDVTEVPPRAEVSYVRHRAVLFCPHCMLRGAVDLR